jgi:hypothetical protein
MVNGWNKTIGFPSAAVKKKSGSPPPGATLGKEDLIRRDSRWNNAPKLG